MLESVSKKFFGIFSFILYQNHWEKN